jgi:hypothetical protein
MEGGARDCVVEFMLRSGRPSRSIEGAGISGSMMVNVSFSLVPCVGCLAQCRCIGLELTVDKEVIILYCKVGEVASRLRHQTNNQRHLLFTRTLQLVRRLFLFHTLYTSVYLRWLINNLLDCTDNDIPL